MENGLPILTRQAAKGGVTMKTKRLPAKYRALLEGFPNAGPNPNITGMKSKYYGKDSVCVMCGKYLYRVGDNLEDKRAAFIYNLAK